MNADRKSIYLLAGVAMIVGSFFFAARAIGGIVTIVYFLCATDFGEFEKTIGESLWATVMASHIPSAIFGVTSFLILFFGGRWMIKGPRMVERWIAASYSQDSKSLSTLEQ